MALAFPSVGLAGFAWVAPGMLVMSALGTSGAWAFRLGYLSGWVRWLVSLCWLLQIPFPLGAIAGWLALSSYLAFYSGVWVWCCCRLLPPDIAEARDAGGQGVIDRFGAMTMLQRQLWTLACAALWVALEMVQGRFLTGFPWNYLGVSQFQLLPIIQIASIAGVYGVSFVLVWFSVALGCAAVVGLRNQTGARLFWGDLMAPMLAVMVVAWFGVRQIVQQPKADRLITAALVQPSIPQTLIWDPNENSNRFRQLIELSQRALESKPDLLIWPEAAVPNLLRYDPEAFRAVTNLVRTRGVWMIVGADDAVPRAGTGPEFDFFNSSFLISPDGELMGNYRKRRLVVFGEYIPLVRWLPFLRHLTPIGDGFRPGDRAIPFEAPELGLVTSVLICFEDTFPHLAREYVTEETDFLLNLTNNGWFGESAAQWQHAATAAFRAVENGLPLVRCANNGLSCWVDPVGGLHAVYFEDRPNDVYGAGFKRVQIPIIEPRKETIYHAYGDWFGWSCVGSSAVMLGMSGWVRRSRMLAA